MHFTVSREHRDYELPDADCATSECRVYRCWAIYIDLPARYQIDQRGVSHG